MCVVFVSQKAICARGPCMGTDASVREVLVLKGLANPAVGHILAANRTAGVTPRTPRRF